VAYGVSGLVRLEDLGLRAAVVADPDISELLLRRYVEPFGTGEAGGAVLATVERFLANRRRPGPTGLDLFIHANTVRYRLARFEAVTGRSLQDVRTVVEVWWALEARRSASTADRMRKSLTKLHPKTSVAPQPSA
jgi:sugar diacid utilization regulator